MGRIIPSRLDWQIRVPIERLLQVLKQIRVKKHWVLKNKLIPDRMLGVPIPVVQTGVKSAGWENKIAQFEPIHS